jgi:hypothetical protein
MEERCFPAIEIRRPVLRWIVILFVFLELILPLHSETRITVAQLEQYLHSKEASKQPDARIADTLGAAELTEQMTESALRRIRSETKLGPLSSEQLDLLAASSIFNAPPAGELPASPAPDATTQQQIIDSARDYVSSALHNLPDFLALRITRKFDDAPELTNSKHRKQKIQLHFIGESRRSVGFSSGREVADPGPADSGISEFQEPALSGLSTSGEYGPILKVVLSDSFQGTVVWSRWQKSATGVLLAVFHYSVPRLASHNLIDLCCYQKSKFDADLLTFRDTPGYHGEIYIDPSTGIIDRITVEAELRETDPVLASGIAVQYGQVDIGGRKYTCPTRGVAVSVVRNFQMESIDGVGREKHINEVSFLNYHKFVSTARILSPE